MYVGVRVPIHDLSDRIGKGVNRRCDTRYDSRRGLGLRFAAVKVPATDPEPEGQGGGAGSGAPPIATFVPVPIFVHRKRMIGPASLGPPTWIWAC